MTKDELKFRAYIEITTYDDNNEEIGEGVIYFGFYSQPFKIRKIEK